MGDQPAIQTEGLSKRFGDVHALQDLNLTVPAASVLGLLGPNGAGKTTAVRILTTLLRPDTGSARVAGLDVVRQPAAVRQVIGLAVLPEVVRRLDAAGLGLSDLAVRRPTLDDVFLSLTGQATQPPDPSEAPATGRPTPERQPATRSLT